MAQAHFTKAVRKDIWQHGRKVVKVHQKGKNAGQSYTDRDRSLPAEDLDDNLLIKKGESCYSWTFRDGYMHVSKTRPKQSQLTQNSFLLELYSIQEEIETLSASESLSSGLDSIKERIENLRDKQEEKMNNMPEGLQGNSPAYEILEERFNALEEWYSELDNIDAEVDDGSFEYDSDDEETEEEQKEQWEGERYDSILEEIQNCTCNL